MSTLKKINNIGENFYSMIFDQTNTIFPKQNFLVISKKRALFMILTPFVMAIVVLVIFSFLDSWTVKFVSSIFVSCANLGHGLYFGEELKFLNTPIRKIALKKSPDLFFVIPNWIMHSVFIIGMVSSLLLALIIMKLFWGNT